MYAWDRDGFFEHDDLCKQNSASLGALAVLVVCKVALILSSGRTGTQFLAHYFDANYEGVIARHEPRPSRLLRFASHAHMVGMVSRERLVALLQHKRSHYIDPLQTPLYIESNPFLSGFIDVIGEVWDDPLIIHIVRDPREHVRSSLNHGTSTGLKGLGNRLLPYWYPDVTKILGLERRPSSVGMAAGVWAVMNRKLREAGPHYARYHTLHYESIFDASHSGLRELCELLGLEYREAGLKIPPSKRINASRLEVIGHWRNWPADACREFERICQPMMREYGYGNEPEWLAKLSSSPR